MEVLLIIPIDLKFSAAFCGLTLQSQFHKVDFVFHISWFFKRPKRVAAIWSRNLLRAVTFRTTNNYLSHTHSFVPIHTLQFFALILYRNAAEEDCLLTLFFTAQTSQNI
jgi:hypothetical protein